MKPICLALTLLALLGARCNLFNSHPMTRFDVGANARDVFVYRDTLLVVADDYLLTYDVSSPKSPSLGKIAPLGRRTNCVAAKDGIAYVGTDSGVAVRPPPGGTPTELYCGGTSQAVTGLTTDSTRLYAASADGITVFRLATPESTKFVPLAGEPTGLARHDTRLFVSLHDWGVRVFNILPGDSFALDTLQLGRHNRAEGVTVSPGGYCVISQGDSGVDFYYSPTPDTVRMDGGAAGSDYSAYATAATDGVTKLAVYEADSSKVIVNQIDNAGGSVSGEELPDLPGFTRRICLGGNGYVYTASGDAGIYIIRE
jgi:hypothetical protein